MRILVVGRSENTVQLSALFPSRPDFRIARFPDGQSAAEVLDGSEPSLALLHVDGLELSALDGLAPLAARGAQVLVLASDASSKLRAAAFDAGAADVIFPPLTARRAEAAVLSVLGRPARRETRFAANVPAILGSHAPGTPTFRGMVLDMSRGGFKARVPASLTTGIVTRLAINPPPPHRIPVLFAVLLASEPDDEPGWNTIRGRFVGLNDEERALLAGYVETLDPEPIEPEVALEALVAMDATAIADADLGTVAGMRLPALTAAEKSALASRQPPELTLAASALIRSRANMLFDLLERSPALAGPAAARVDPETLRAEARNGAERVREALGKAVAEDDSARIRELNDLQARMTVATDLVERVIGRLTGESVRTDRGAGLQEVSGPVTFDRPKEPFSAPVAESVAPRSRGRVVGVLAAAVVMTTIAAAGIAMWMSVRERRARDPAREAVTSRPAMVIDGVRVRSIFTDGSGRRVAVVDGSWFSTAIAERERAARSISARAAAGRKDVTLRDYRARTLATVSSSGALTLYPDPVAER